MHNVEAPDDPYAILGTTPTLDPRIIKRAYFAAVRQAPPHADPAAFQRVRAAYELLSDASLCAAAYFRAPVASADRLARWSERWQSKLDAVCATQRAEQLEARAVAMLIERCTRVELPPRSPS